MKHEHKDYSGMTVNERLWVSGSFYKFEKALVNDDLDVAAKILRKLDLEEESIKDVLKPSVVKRWLAFSNND